MPNILYQTFAGLSDSIYSGVKDSFAKMVGINIHDTPGSITVNQKLSKDSGSTVTGLCRVSLSLSTGEQYWFDYGSGKVWERSSGGSWRLAHTTTPAAGGAGCLGAIEYNGYIFWATESRLHRIAIGDISDWGANATEDWQTFSGTDSEFHPMIIQNQTLFIGDANLASKVTSGFAFTANALDLLTPNRIKSMAEFDIDLVMGTQIASTANKCNIVRWDTVQTSPQFNEPVQENGVNSFLWVGTALVAQAGRYGNFYFYDGIKLQPYKRLPGTWSSTKYGEVYPSATGNLRGIPIFGFSNGSGNPADQGVYSMGRYSKDYPVVINGPEYIISQDDVTDVEIGAILVEDQDLYVSWKEGSNYGVDKLDYSAKYASAYMEFRVLIADPDSLISYLKYFADYSSLPSGTSLTFAYKKNHASSFTTIASSNRFDDTEIKQYYSEETVDARAFQLRMDFTVSGNNAPVLELLGIQTQDG